MSHGVRSRPTKLRKTGASPGPESRNPLHEIPSHGPDPSFCAPQGLADGDRLREGGYGAETFKLGPTYVIDRNGEAVARLVLSGDAQTYSGTLTTCPDTGIRLSEAATGELPPIVVTSSRPAMR